MHYYRSCCLLLLLFVCERVHTHTHAWAKGVVCIFKNGHNTAAMISCADVHKLTTESSVSKICSGLRQHQRTEKCG